MDWNLAKWLRKSNCLQKCKNKKMKIKKLTTGALKPVTLCIHVQCCGFG